MSGKILVTGGAGFIGSALVRHIINATDDAVCVVDKLTYAGNLSTLKPVADSPRYRFERADIGDGAAMSEILRDFRPDKIINLAAETHVDRSIDSPREFIFTNIVGTYTLLEAARHYYAGLGEAEQKKFRFHQVSTDEVYGELTNSEDKFAETTPYAPSSPYSASKASADHLVRAWHRTFGVPTLVTNCSNNYGPYQFPEKLIPLVTLRAVAGQPLPVYGQGLQIRDWLHVEDHARALYLVATQGTPGETYNIGGNCEKPNIEVVRAICAALDLLRPLGGGKSYAEQITFVPDRPGHDFRYAINADKIRRELNWQPQENFATALPGTVKWFLDNEKWCAEILSGKYNMQRLGRGDKA